MLYCFLESRPEPYEGAAMSQLLSTTRHFFETPCCDGISDHDEKCVIIIIS